MRILKIVNILWVYASNVVVNPIKHRETERENALQGCFVIKKDNNMHVDCSSRNLTYIPTLPEIATSVDLSNNQIRTITAASTFARMISLRDLDLSNNPLELVSNNIFYGLSNLTKLSIRNTLLFKQEGLVLDTLLFGLYNLKILHFTFQLQEYRKVCPLECHLIFRKQPFGSVSSLRALDIMEIDSALLEWRFNASSPQNIFRTKWLSVINGYFCFYGTFAKQQFDNMSQLKVLKITNPFLTAKMNDDFLSDISQLEELSIIGPNVPCSYMGAVDLIYNLTKAVSSQRNLKSLTLIGISFKTRQKLACSWGIYNLSRLRNLYSINLIDNSLSFSEYGVCDKFPPFVEKMNLQGNCFSSSDINRNILVSNRQIKIINASDQSKCAFKYRKRDASPNVLNIGYDVEEKYSLEFFVLTNNTEEIDFGNHEDYFPNLTYLDLSMNNRLAKTSIPKFFSSSRPSLRYLNLSTCRVFSLEKHSFDHFSKLKILDLSSNNLGEMGCDLGEQLESLISLEDISLASNDITCLEPETFSLMQNIRVINVYNNKLQHFNMNFEHTRNLEQLILSSNRIQSLSKRTILQLDMIASKGRLTVDLSENMLLCTCENLYFLQWIRTTNVHLKNKEDYVCSYSNGTVTTLRYITPLITDMTSQCSSKTVLFVLVSALSAGVIVTVGAILIYRFRWKLRYFYYKTKIKIPYKRSGNDYEPIFEYDAFISYSAEDHKIAREGTLNELESNRGMHVCIHERDFLAGETIALNISRGIHNSKRTILFLSKHFLGSEWCKYELNIARMEALHTNRKVILIVMIEEIIQKTLPFDILDIINTYTYLEYPKNGSKADADVFWSKCADFVFND